MTIAGALLNRLNDRARVEDTMIWVPGGTDATGFRMARAPHLWVPNPGVPNPGVPNLAPEPAGRDANALA